MAKRTNPEIRLTEIQNDDCYIARISPAIDHGDFPFHFLLKLEYMEQHGDDVVKAIGEYHASILAVSTVAAAKHLEEAAKSSGMTLEEFKALPSDAQHLLLADYGIAATLWQKGGNDEKALMEEAEKELVWVDMFFGFAMDKFQSRIGATGWDWIKGDPTLRERKIKA